MSFRVLRPEGLDLQTTRLNHKPSISSDMMSSSSRSGPGAVPPASPPPAYIAELAASHLLTTELEHAAAVLPSALSLVNGFLDHVLLQILRTAQSISLSSLRGAIPKVLNRSLTRGALEAADIELQDYQDEASHEQRQALGVLNDGSFDVELAWRMARLRCMVYTRLGDMEEEDEEEYLEQDQLREPLSLLDARSKQNVIMTPLAAIFVTAVVEYLGEQALYFAAQNAQKRQAQPAVSPSSDLHPVADFHETIVDEADILSLGQGSPLLKLWRSWRMSTRTSRNPLSRSISPETLSPDSPSHNRLPNHIPFITPIAEEQKEVSPEHLPPDRIPLPDSDNDAREIEFPGVTENDSDGAEGQISLAEQEPYKKRPTSMLIMPGQFTDVPTPSSIHTPDRDSNRPSWARTRSNSLPTPSQTPYTSPQMARKWQSTEKGGGEYAPDRQGVNLASTTSPEQSDTEGSSSEPNSNVNNVDKADPPSHVSSAVAAIASALGGNAASTASTAEDPQNSNSRTSRDSLKATKHRTVAEEMLGYSTNVAPPKDAVTGSSITTFGDFDNLHIPVQDESRRSQQPTPVPRYGNTSDPENFALTSAEEDLKIKQPDQAPSKALVSDPRPVPSFSRLTAQTIASSKSRSSEALRSDNGVVPRNARREATIYNKAVTDARRSAGSLSVHVPDNIESDAPKTGESLQAEDFPLPPSTRNSQTGALTSARNSEQGLPTSPRSGTQPVRTPVEASIPETIDYETATTTAPTTMQYSSITPVTSSWPDVVSPHNSSAEAVKVTENSNASYSRHQSHESGYSEYSDRSSSSSKLLGFNRDLQNQMHIASQQQGVSRDLPNQMYTAQRQGVANPVTNGVFQTQQSDPDRTAAFNQAATKAQRRPPHLRLRSQSSENVLGDTDIDTAKKRSLEVLIKSDETLHYTLTPQSARGETPEFPASVKTKTQTQELADFLRNTSPPSDGPANNRALRDNTNGLRSNPIGELEGTAVAQPFQRGKIIPHGSRYPQVPPSPSKMRNPVGEPRGARTELATTRDLADYARSTGPENEEQLPRALVSRPGTAATTRTAPDTSRQHARATGESSGSVDMGRPATTAGKPVNRLKFQARDARPSDQPQTSELVDFLRDGPPRTPAEQAKDRLQAPSRTPFNSSVTQGTTSGSATRFSDVSAATASVIAPSTNSRTALLDAPKGFGPSANANWAGNTQLEEDGFPKRTRRKVRDPYAIDESDDEDLEEEVIPEKPKRQEESLIDFLRNTAPPPGMTTQPIMSATAAQRALNNYNQKNTLPRNGESDKEVSDAPRRSSVAREESPHLTQTGSKYDKFKPTQTTHATHIERNRQKPRAEPRDAVRASGTTADLAQYLKTSGPPPTSTFNQADDSRPNTATSKDEAGFLKFFSKRKGSIRR